MQLVAGSVAVQSTLPPDVNVTVPVAPGGRPVTHTVTGDPTVTEPGETMTVMCVSALRTVNVAPVATADVLLASPEYVAVTG